MRESNPYCSPVTDSVIPGPLAGMISHVVSIRIIVFLGVLVSAVAVICCYFATSILHITLLLGGIFGIGMGLAYNLCPVLINQYFLTKRAMACGLFYAGSTAGALIGPLVVRYLLDNQGVQMMWVIMGGSLFIGMCGALVLTPSENYFKVKDEPKTPDEDLKMKELGISYISKPDQVILPVVVLKTKPTFCETVNSWCLYIKDIFSSMPYVLTTLAYIFFHNTYIMLTIIMPATAVDMGYPQSKENTLLCYACLDLIGRLIPGMLSYYRFISNINMFNVSLMVLGVSLFFMQIASNAYIMLGLCGIFGFTGGVLLCLTPVLVAQYTEPDKTAIAFGLSNFFNGCVSIARPFLIEYSKISTGNYFLIFNLLGVANTVIALMWGGYRLYVRTKRTKSWSPDHSLDDVSYLSRAASIVM
ncbi:SLC16A14 [Cordylochernes scorpioides]|uniref:SLC16A14 n=1 Tax=Cordylochernes scorpioides TaxID=51811 RepID=A0ABY6LLE3_9ARAC|nr:SLC16A14 [Cordylochernes scorpioides]